MKDGGRDTVVDNTKITEKASLFAHKIVSIHPETEHSLTPAHADAMIAEAVAFLPNPNQQQNQPNSE